MHLLLDVENEIYLGWGLIVTPWGVMFTCPNKATSHPLGITIPSIFTGHKEFK